MRLRRYFPQLQQVARDDRVQTPASKRPPVRILIALTLGLVLVLGAVGLAVVSSNVGYTHQIFHDPCSLVDRGTQTVEGFPVYNGDVPTDPGLGVSWSSASIFTVREHAEKTRQGLDVPSFTALVDASLALSLKSPVKDGRQPNAFQFSGKVQLLDGKCVMVVDSVLASGPTEGG